jgi:hypothetical protein
LATAGGQKMTIECYECGVEGLDGAFDESNGWYSKEFTILSASAGTFERTVTRSDGLIYNVYAATVELNDAADSMTFWNYTSSPDNRAYAKYKTQAMTSGSSVSSKYDAANGLGFASLVFPRVQVDSETLGGTFNLIFDTSGSGKSSESPYKCRVCREKSNEITAAINPLTFTRAGSDSLETRLSELSNVMGGNITSTYFRPRSGRTTSEGVQYNITFSGNMVNGDVPTLIMRNSMLGEQAGTSNAIDIKELYQGHEIRGQFKLEFAGEQTLAIDAFVCPMASNPDSDYTLYCQNSKSVQERLQALPTVITVDVTRHDLDDGVGGLEYKITFTGNDGNLMLLNGTDYGITGMGAEQGGVHTAVVLEEELQPGNYLGGHFSISLASKTRMITEIPLTNGVIVTSFGHGFQDGDSVEFSCAGTCAMSEIHGQQYKVASSTTNTFTLTKHDDSPVNFLTGYTALGNTVAIAEKVVRVLSISKATNALITTDGPHGLSSTHVNKYVALFDLEDWVGNNCLNGNGPCSLTKYLVVSVPTSNTLTIDLDSSTFANPEACASTSSLY